MAELRQIAGTLSKQSIQLPSKAHTVKLNDIKETIRTSATGVHIKRLVDRLRCQTLDCTAEKDAEIRQLREEKLTLKTEVSAVSKAVQEMACDVKEARVKEIQLLVHLPPSSAMIEDSMLTALQPHIEEIIFASCAKVVSQATADTGGVLRGHHANAIETTSISDLILKYPPSFRPEGLA
ncbi:hypothetical protein K488DRAFT_83027 [Vararia minispora EC-137]|uniref:Uncharacterized protein n=1 Tax=Vararia minispora EC-137 TaxID=1314806 RepID=A0ACB8QVT8_9AGAM|nr:hypothetical protein K488DRAFT_83027 [Vararia minispora EC-137]